MCVCVYSPPAAVAVGELLFYTQVTGVFQTIWANSTENVQGISLLFVATLSQTQVILPLQFYTTRTHALLHTHTHLHNSVANRSSALSLCAKIYKRIPTSGVLHKLPHISFGCFFALHLFQHTYITLAVINLSSSKHTHTYTSNLLK
jgi:hypothetical protein